VSAVAPFVYASGPDCDAPGTVVYGTSDVDMDGFFIGANGCLYDPGFVLSDDVPVVGGEYRLRRSGTKRRSGFSSQPL